MIELVHEVFHGARDALAVSPEKGQEPGELN